MSKKQCTALCLCILLTGVMISSAILLKYNSTKTYRYQHIVLDNNNIGVHEKIVDYICTDNVEVENFPNQRYFYASTWRNPMTTTGECFIKIEVRS